MTHILLLLLVFFKYVNWVVMLFPETVYLYATASPSICNFIN